MLLPLAFYARSWAPGRSKPSGEIGTARLWVESMNEPAIAMAHVQRIRQSSTFRAAVQEAQVPIDKFPNAEDRAA